MLFVAVLIVSADDIKFDHEIEDLRYCDGDWPVCF